jgi:acyl carrier protein
MSESSFEQFVSRLRGLWRVEIPDQVTPDTSLFDDLAIDSIQAFELLIIIESVADCMVPPVEVPEMYTLADTFDYFCELRATVLDDS